jgi:hypothetical protein
MDPVTGMPRFQAGDNKSTADDSGFVNAMITTISASYEVDAKPHLRVWLFKRCYDVLTFSVDC